MREAAIELSGASLAALLDGRAGQMRISNGIGRECRRAAVRSIRWLARSCYVKVSFSICLVSTIIASRHAVRSCSTIRVRKMQVCCKGIEKSMMGGGSVMRKLRESGLSLETLAQDLRYSIRLMLKSPGGSVCWQSLLWLWELGPIRQFSVL